MKRPRSIFRTVVAPIVVAIGVIPTLAIALWETVHGRGAASYSNVYGLDIPHVSVIILVVLVAVVMAAAYIGRVVYFWRNGRDAAAKLRRIDSSGPAVESEKLQ